MEGAKNIHEQVLEIMRRVLGAEHLNTLTSMNNLAATLENQGNRKGARKMHEQVLEIRRRVLGAEYTETSTRSTLSGFWAGILSLLEHIRDRSGK